MLAVRPSRLAVNISPNQDDGLISNIVANGIDHVSELTASLYAQIFRFYRLNNIMQGLAWVDLDVLASFAHSRRGGRLKAHQCIDQPMISLRLVPANPLIFHSPSVLCSLSHDLID